MVSCVRSVIVAPGMCVRIVCPEENPSLSAKTAGSMCVLLLMLAGSVVAPNWTRFLVGVLGSSFR
jgi:hypothetical protein